MIKFFRKIRQKLLEQNRVSKYLLYAFGEIILVVIGILIALQINNWNEEHKINKIRTQKLSQIESDLKADVISLEEGILIKEKEIATLKNYHDRLSQSNASIDTLDKILNLEFSGGVRIGFSGFNNITYNSMVQSGELGILSDDLVKDLSNLNIQQQKSEDSFNDHWEIYLNKSQTFQAHYPVKGKIIIVGDGPLGDYLREHRNDKNFIVAFNEVFIAKWLMYSQNLRIHRNILEITKAILKNHFAE